MNAKSAALVIVAALVTVLGFFIRPMVFRPAGPPPPSPILPLFIFLHFWDALAFGVGVALLAYLAFSYRRWLPGLRGSLLVLYFLALWFTLLNWIHDGMHESGASPPNFAYLAVTEYVFHVPWLIFAVALVLVGRKLAKAYPIKPSS